MKPFCERIGKFNETTPDDNVKNDLSDIEIRLYERQYIDDLYRHMLFEGDIGKSDNFEIKKLIRRFKRFINKEVKSDNGNKSDTEKYCGSYAIKKAWK